MIGVPDLADGRTAGEEDAAELTGGEPEDGVRAVLRDELDGRARRPRHARALAGLQLDAWTSVPVGMFASGSALPALMSASGPDSTVEPTRSRAGARMYAFAPSA